MATLSQAKEMFKSIDPGNTGLIARDDLKTLMQEIGGDQWAGDNFDSMLEACGVERGTGDVKYGAFLEQLLAGEDKPAAAVPGTPSSEDKAEAEAIVKGVCGRLLASMEDEPASLFNRLGGAPAVDAAVEKFYEKVMADELLQPLFAHVAMAGLKTMQKKFLTVAFGGPNDYTGKSLRDAHKGKGISDAHFGAVAGHLSATLTELGVAETELGEAMTIAASTKGDIVEVSEAKPDAAKEEAPAGDAAEEAPAAAA